MLKSKCSHLKAISADSRAANVLCTCKSVNMWAERCAVWIILVLTLCVRRQHQSGQQQEMKSSPGERRKPSESKVHGLTAGTLPSGPVANADWLRSHEIIE